MFWRIKKCLFLNCFALRIIRHIGRILSIFVLKSEIKSYKSDLPEILNFKMYEEKVSEPKLNAD